MIKDNEKLIVYLNSKVNSAFKILPLYEEKNVGVKVYIDSLLIELSSLNEVIEVEHGDEYLSLLATLKGVRKEINKEDSKHSVVKRESFKCIDIIKKLVSRLEEDV